MEREEIRALREQLELTQEVFAQILGVSFATVNRWENGKSEPKTGGRMARVNQVGITPAFCRPSNSSWQVTPLDRGSTGSGWGHSAPWRRWQASRPC
jgi:transcriptional regulator with XRE-family HTH domain